MIRRLLLLAALCTLSTPGHTWGTKGHTWVNQNAVALLPDGVLKDFLTPHRGDLAYNSLIPDFQWKDGAMARLEGPEHYLDLEVLAPQPQPVDVPRTRLAAMQLYTERGLSLREGGFLPWRIEELYWRLVNAFKTDPAAVLFYAGILGHYAADAAQPLHTTIHFDGRADRRVEGSKFLRGIHADYEIVFVEDHGIEFRRSSLELAAEPQRLEAVFTATVDLLFDSFHHVDRLYQVAERYQGEERWPHWERELGGLTRDRLAKATSFVASLWWSAWLAAGSPILGPADNQPD